MTDNMKRLISSVKKLEWKMFSAINGEDKSGCQENPDTFFAMREGQLSAWSEEAAESYYNDLTEADEKGINLMRQKFLSMMESTSPKEFAALKDELPEFDAEKMRLVRELSGRMLGQSAVLYREYPYITSSSRPLYAIEDSKEVTSVETYQKCELLTYSSRTLEALKRHLEALEQRGVSLNELVLRNSLKHYGYESISEAEEKSEKYWRSRMAGGKAEF